ncbi:MAG: hypothetical protein ACI37Q_05040 [Candidatus Gastranaerophilaceae bacterium]
MKFGICEKITIGILVILVLCAAYNIFGMVKAQRYKESLYGPTTDELELPANITQLSKKYNVYTDLYNSDKPILTYGYAKHAIVKKLGSKFHKELQSRLEQENLDFKVVSYKNWRQYDEQIEEDNAAVYGGDDSKCLMENPSVQELDSVRDISTNCLRNACIIDVKQNKYILMDRDIDFIIEQIKEYNKK